MYDVLKTCVRTPDGIRITKKYHETGDAVSTLEELDAAAFTSTNAALTRREIIGKLTSVRLTSSWNGTATDFINAFMSSVAQYNDHCPDPGTELPEVQTLQYLKAALCEVNVFKHVADREIENQVATGAKPYNLQQYLRIIQHIAITFDDERQRGKHRRTANLTEFGHDSDDDSVATVEFARELIANFHDKSQSRKPRPPPDPAARLKDDVWSKISKPARRAWQSIPQEDRKLMARQVQRSFFTHQDSNSDSETEEHEDTTTDPNADTPTDTHETREVNQSTTTHPADIRRVMGNDKHKKPKAKRASNMTQLNFASKRTSRPPNSPTLTDSALSCGEKLDEFVDDEPTFASFETKPTSNKVQDKSEDLYTFEFGSNAWGESSDEDDDGLDFQ